MITRCSTVILALISSTSASDWNYLQNGADWEAACIKPEGTKFITQSPIDLPSFDSEGFNLPLLEGIKDQRMYFNQVNKEVVMNGHTSQVNVNTGAGYSFFRSMIPMRHFEFSDTKDTKEAFRVVPGEYQAQQFHFHSPSEHTVDGVLMDLEMHTVHYDTNELVDATADDPFDGSKNHANIAALGIMFSVDKSTAVVSDADVRIIDNFFESLQWDATENPTPTNIAYGNLVGMVDFHNRYVYRGSVTTPPCATTVFWNVVAPIYPIKAEHVKLFKEQLDRTADAAYATKTLSSVGNNRVIQATTAENQLMFVYNPVEEDSGNSGLIVGSLVVIVIMAIVSCVLTCVVVKISMNAKKVETQVGSLQEGGEKEQSTRFMIPIEERM